MKIHYKSFSGAYLYRRERKKHGRKTSEPVAQSSEDGSSGSPAQMDTDDGHGPTSSSEENSSVEDDCVSIELTQDLRQILEQDYFMVNTKNKVGKIFCGCQSLYDFLSAFEDTSRTKRNRHFGDVLATLRNIQTVWHERQTKHTQQTTIQPTKNKT